MGVPIIPFEKKIAGLDKARNIRTKRSHIKKMLKSGEINLPDILNDYEKYRSYIENMKLIDILVSLPKTGMVKAKRILSELNISERKKINGLSTRQIKAFKEYFNL